MFLEIYISFFSILLLVYFIGWRKNSTKNQSKLGGTYQASTISVIIPFRNEAHNLPKLVDSIKKLSIQPLEIIWVNDNSTDNSLQKLQNLPLHHSIFTLTNTEQGKKIAIRKGLEIAKGMHVLTWDADIIVPTDYFYALEQTHVSELSIIPIRMKGNTFLELLYELDYYFLNALNIGLTGYSTPIVASGANLLFNKASFVAIDSFKNHHHIASGDDHFLLHDFKRAKKSIQTVTHSNLVVETQSPTSLKEFFHQRLRWISKSKYIVDNTTTWISVLGVIYTMGFVVLLFTNHWKEILILKLLFDFLIFVPYLDIVQRKKISWTLPWFTLLYPVYFLIIGGLATLVKPIWKGRK
jgi:biofilm PGA synthesis N-glycosyltransferase PgaC